MFSTFDQLLAFYCAPTLAGVKPASLMSYKKTGQRDLCYFIDYYYDKMARKDIFLEIVAESPQRSLLLVYRKKMLEDILQDRQVQLFLKYYGYHGHEAKSTVKHIKERIEKCRHFPHEIGVLLGYPLADTIAFMKNKGQNYQLCGYWKVYFHPDEARKIFAEYNRCRTLFFELLDQKISIGQLIEATL